jgi:3',5'-cyclic AMP phosphodiesterase CpdA
VRQRHDRIAPLIDPRLGDVEDDASSTKRRSLLSLAGSLLAEVSLPKLLLAWGLLIVVPSILLGLAPLVATAWIATLSSKVADPLRGLWPFLLMAVVLAIGWLGGRPLFRIAEQGFWSLNGVAVQPAYALCRELLRTLAERLLPRHDAASAARIRAGSAAAAGIILCAIGVSIALLVWPSTRWIGQVAELASPGRLIIQALANACVVVSAYLAGASLVWGVGDATMDQPQDLPAFDAPSPGAKIWRVAHLSDVHVVGERYGFRLESGRSGPRGNERLARVLARLETIHANQPLDLILITGDETDAGRSAEWAEFMTALQRHPQLAERTLILPGNHDINVVDRANPARLELPTSPTALLRKLRTLSAIDQVQGNRVYVIDRATSRLGGSLSSVLEAHRKAIGRFADVGSLRLSASLAKVWAEVFPMVLPPQTGDGLGVIVVNSTAETHFSFTNALGVVSSEQVQALTAVAKQFPRARWILALHHHLVEYPRPGATLSLRIGTALVNGTWLVRQLQQLGDRIIAMHGHRHFDWIGRCGSLRIISAPSPVMEATDDQTTYFLIQRLAAGPEGRLCLLEPERIDIAGTKAPSAHPRSAVA